MTKTEEKTKECSICDGPLETVGSFLMCDKCDRVPPQEPITENV